MLLLIELRALEATFFKREDKGEEETCTEEDQGRVIDGNLSKMRARPTLNFAYAHLPRLSEVRRRKVLERVMLSDILCGYRRTT